MIEIERPTDRAAGLEAIAREVRACTSCRLHQTRTMAVPGEGSPDTEVVFVGEGPGFNEDRQGRPFVGRAGALLGKFLGSLGWRREDVFITNIVKCRPPENRDPEADEIAACAPYLRRQLEILDPALVVTLGRHSLGRFMPGERISQAHGMVRSIDPATGAANALAFALYHPAAALRTADIERTTYQDVARIPAALLDARARRAAPAAAAAELAPLPATLPAPLPATLPEPATEPVAEPAAGPTPTRESLPESLFQAATDPALPEDQLTLF